MLTTNNVQRNWFAPNIWFPTMGCQEMVSGPHNLFFIFSSSTSVSDSLSQVNSSVTHLTSMKNYFMIMKTYPLLKTFSDTKNSRVLFIFVINLLKCFSFKLSHFCIAGEIQNFPTTSPYVTMSASPAFAARWWTTTSMRTWSLMSWERRSRGMERSTLRSYATFLLVYKP